MLPSNATEFEVAEGQAKKPRRRGGGLFVMLGLLVVLIGIVVIAVTRLPTGSLSRPTTAAAPARTAVSAPAAAAPATGAPADAATQAAIQDVIHKLDDAQAQAIASNHPKVMAPTAT